ncbi:DedA family protein [Actinoplanes derwentensis]|uniref:DedA family protein n=1 Tax=Actinoplanes derwentensis TaxID=113562 RepID=UPI0012FDFF35|nr:hypothetical protein [Actinoplanes derwentensis]
MEGRRGRDLRPKLSGMDPYLVLGPLVLVEGPAATITAGSLIGAGAAAFWPVWGIVVAAEVLGDSLLYLAGRSAARPFARGPAFAQQRSARPATPADPAARPQPDHLTVRPGQRSWMARLIDRPTVTAMLDRLAGMPLHRLVITAKLVDVVALPAFVAAGLAGVPYRRFLAWVVATAAVRGLVLIGLGVLIGDRLAGLLALPGGILLLTAAVAVPVLTGHLLLKRYLLRKGRLPCVSSSAPTPTHPTSTGRPISPSAWLSP